jgi:predicted dehydrogenase
MIDVAVIGAGAISSFHLDGYFAFRDRCRIVAVAHADADADVTRARARIAEYGLADAVAFDGVDAVLADGRNVDLASVCTPPGTHAEIAVRLLEAGVSTLLEKPMAPITAQTVPLPLPADDPYRTRDGLLAAAPRFHEQTVSVGEFETNEITT